MSVREKIDELKSEAEAQLPQKSRRKKILLYTEGLKSKMLQADYALSQLTFLADRTDTAATTTATEEYQISTKVGFYCDAFWAFLYSSLDVLAHVINQTLKLGMKEKEVSFKRVAEILNSKHKGTMHQQKVGVCLRSNVFKNVDAYRNCSTHRREIYIVEETVMVKGTPGYNTTATGLVQSVSRVICDNPLIVTPRISQNRKVPQYLKTAKDKIFKQIEAILKNIKPVK